MENLVTRAVALGFMTFVGGETQPPPKDVSPSPSGNNGAQIGLDDGGAVQSDPANPWLTYGLLVAIGLSGGLGDIWIFNWARSSETWWLLVACFAWVVSLIMFGLLLKWDNRTFCAAFMLSTVFHVVLVVGVDLVYFGGRLSQLEWVGMGMATVAIVLFELGREHLPDAPPMPTPAKVREAADTAEGQP